MSFSLAEREAYEKKLREFALAVQREVCLRANFHKPASVKEHKQYLDGLCAPGELDCVKELVR